MVWTLLRETGIKRRYLAQHLGVTIGYLNQVQYGQAPISKNLRRKIADFLNVDEHLLFSDLDRELSKGG
jgi:transcriptional regulator with XRE-family HTH domain